MLAENFQMERIVNNFQKTEHLLQLTMRSPHFLHDLERRTVRSPHLSYYLSNTFFGKKASLSGFAHLYDAERKFGTFFPQLALQRIQTFDLIGRDTSNVSVGLVCPLRRDKLFWRERRETSVDFCAYRE